MQGSIKAELFFQRLDHGGVYAFCAGVLRGHIQCAGFNGRTGDAGRDRYGFAADLRDHLVHRPTRRQLHDEEIDGDDAEQGRHDQSQAFEDVACQLNLDEYVVPGPAESGAIDSAAQESGEPFEHTSVYLARSTIVTHIGGGIRRIKHIFA